MSGESISLAEFAVAFAAVLYVTAAIRTFVWGHITYTTTLRFPMLSEYEWEKRAGARAMILAPVWPLFYLITYAKSWGRNAGHWIGRVWRDAVR